MAYREIGFQITKLPNYKITKIGTHGKHNCTQQRRTQESETHRAEEAQNREPSEAPRIRTRVEEAKSKEDGARTVEAVNSSRLSALGSRFGREGFPPFQFMSQACEALWRKHPQARLLTRL
jgi:hypothetical protein